MTREDKDLLLKDLCARLPYKVKAQIPDEYGGYTSAIESIDIDGYVVDFEGVQIDIGYIKPYLFPMSSMPKEQNLEYLSTCRGGNAYCPTYKSFDWLDKNHFDYRGLIEKGLAIDATDKNIY